MPTLGEAIVSITADKKGLTTGLHEAERETQDFSKKAERALERVDRSFQNITNSAKQLAKIGGITFGGLIAAITTSVRATTEHENAMAKLESAIAGTGRAIDAAALEEYAEQLQSVSMFSNEANIEAMAMLTTFQLTEDEIRKLMPRVQNLAAMYDMDLRQSAIQLGRALTSGAGALSRYGITMSEAEQEAFRLADQQEKINILMDVFDKNTGPAATRMANTLTGAWRRMMNEVDDLRKEIGRLFDNDAMNMLETARAVITVITNRIQSLDSETARNIRNWVLLGTAIAGFVTAGSLGIVMLATLIKSFSILIGVLAIVKSPIFLLMAAVGLLATAWIKDWGNIQSKTETAWAVLDKIFSGLSSWLKDAWEWVIDISGNAWNWIKDTTWEEKLSSIKSWLTDGWQWAINIAGNAWEWLSGTTMKEKIKDIREYIQEQDIWKIALTIASIAGLATALKALGFAKLAGLFALGIKFSIAKIAGFIAALAAIGIKAGAYALTFGISKILGFAAALTAIGIKLGKYALMFAISKITGFMSALIGLGVSGGAYAINFLISKITGFLAALKLLGIKAGSYVISFALAKITGFVVALKAIGIKAGSYIISFGLAKITGFMAALKAIGFAITGAAALPAFKIALVIGAVFGGWQLMEAIKPHVHNALNYIDENLLKPLENRLPDWMVKDDFGPDAAPRFPAHDYSGNLEEHKSGGYTGNVGTSTPAGVVHGGEWVMPAWMVNRFPGLAGMLEGMRQGKGYQSGGGVNIPGLSGAREALTGATADFDGVFDVIVNLFKNVLQGMLNMVREQFGDTEIFRAMEAFINDVNEELERMRNLTSDTNIETETTTRKLSDFQNALIFTRNTLFNLANMVAQQSPQLRNILGALADMAPDEAEGGLFELAIAGAKAAGHLGALGAIFSILVTETEAFSVLMSAISPLINSIVQILSGVLMPIFELLAKAVSTVNKLLIKFWNGLMDLLSLIPFVNMEKYKIAHEEGADAIEGTARAMRNVPEGLKIAEMAFRAATPIQIPSAAVGGTVTRSGIAEVHKGEIIANKQQQSAMGGNKFIFNIDNVWGVDDLDRKIKRSVDKASKQQGLGRYGLNTAGGR